MRDLEDGTRLLDGLENVHLMGNPGSGHFVVPQDVPVQIRDLHEWKAFFEYSGKPGAGHTYSRRNARYIIKMAEAIVGGEEELRSKPMISYECEATSPLVYSTNSLEIMEEYARLGLPVSFNSMPLAGATSPVTFAGTVVIHLAEVLSGIVVTQLMNPRMPVAYGLYACSFDMRTALQCYGSVNTGLIRAAEAQLARHYQLPSFSHSLVTDSRICDAQCGYEMGMTMLLCAMSGCNSNGPGGQIGADQESSYEGLVIADEIAGSVYRIIEGINVSEDTLALEVIQKVGIGGQYLAQAHTREHYPREHFISSMFDAWDWESWKKRGAKELVTRAREKAEKIMNTHQPEPLDGDVKSRLEGILRDAEREISS
jgi:trimethylamine--corrinoid protein Co-methyltransferase